MDNKRILFVCLGNICRSPAAEGIMKALISKNGFKDPVFVDSAGTIAFHTGEKPDLRMIDHAAKRGYELDHHARKFDPGKDFDQFDYIITMDNQNYADIKSFDDKEKYNSKIFKMTDFSNKYNVDEVPDPYYLGPSGFGNVINILEDACVGLLNKIKNGTI